MSSVEDTIRTKLEGHFKPVRLVVENQSHLHAGHAGDNGTGETHFAVEQSRIACHRMVHDILDDDLSTRIHALSIVAKAP
jgi:BolA family transcriptional regulator, general stress-responsive regulator